MTQQPTQPHEPPHGGGLGRGRRAILACAKAAGLAVVFGAAAIGGIALHGGLRAPRELARERVNGLLAASFQGEVRLQKIDLLRLDRLEGVDAEVFDPEGRRVLVVRGLSLRLETMTLVRSLFSGDRLKIGISDLDIESAEVMIEQNDEGELGIERAFASREPEPSGPARPTEVRIARIRLDHTWVHGRLASLPLIDVDLDDLSGSLSSGPEATEIGVDGLTLRARGLRGVSPEGTLVAHALLPTDEDGRRIGASFDGQLGAVPVFVDVSLEGRVVAAVLDVPETDAAAVNALAPGQLQLAAPLSAHAEAHGQLPLLYPELTARIGEGEIDATGSVRLPEGPGSELVATAQIEVLHLDASHLQRGAPASDLSASLLASVTSRANGELSGSFDLGLDSGHVQGELVPAASVRGDFSERSLRGSAVVHERGAPTTMSFAIVPRDGGESPNRLTFASHTTIADLNAIPRLGPIGRGRVQLSTDGRIELDSQELDVSVRAQAAGVLVSGVALDSASVAGQLAGSAASPSFSVRAAGVGLKAQGFAFSSVELGASGTPTEIDLRGSLRGDPRSPSLEGRAHVSRADALTISGARVEVSRKDVSAVALVASARVDAGAVALRGLEIRGLGEPVRADVQLGPGRLVVKAVASDVDLARVARLLGREEDVRGHLAFDVDARATRSDAHGHLNLQLRGLRAQGVEGGDVRVETELDGRRVRGELDIDLGKAGQVRVHARRIVLGGPVFEATAWRRATGDIGLEGHVDLAAVAARLPADMLPVSSAAGRLALRGSASRGAAHSDPSLELELTTTGLALRGKPAVPTQASGPVSTVPWRLAGIDTTVTASFDGGGGDAEVGAVVRDRKGTIASLEISGRPPLTRVLNGDPDARALLRAVPISARVVVPRRSFDDLPRELGRIPVEGQYQLEATLEGTLRAPKLALHAEVASFTARGSAACTAAVDVKADLTYDGKQAELQLEGVSGGRQVIDGRVALALDAEQALGGARPLAWDASAQLELERFPLEAVNALLIRPIVGNVSGTLAVDDLHTAASMTARLELRDLALDRARLPGGEIEVTMKDGAFVAEISLEQSDGHLHARASGAMQWGAQLMPSLDLGRPIDLALNARNFRVNAAKPFVEGVFTELDGRIDSSARLRVDPGGKSGTVDGAITLREGALEIPQIGERFHGVQGRVVMQPWGTLKLESFEARGSTGKLTASAEAVLDGLALRSAKGRVLIPKGEGIPIAVEGVPMGRAHGEITTTATMAASGERLDVRVDVPMLKVELPSSSGNSVQPLEPDPNVSVGFHDGKRFVPVALGKPKKPRADSDLAVHARINLGKDVELKRDTMLAVTLTGGAVVEVADETRVTGEIRLVRGKLDVQGKLFTIERGVVSFTGSDPANPLIQATAYWDAPDGTRVYADFAGFVSSGKLTLRSEPALSEDEILALILFGSADGGFGASAGGDPSSAALGLGVAGGVVTEGLNKALTGVTSRVSTRIDSSDVSGPQPQIVVQITKSLSASLGYKIGPSAPGGDPDRAQLTLDWRFFKNWSFDATIGDRGSTEVGVVWRLRY